MKKMMMIGLMLLLITLNGCLTPMEINELAEEEGVGDVTIGQTHIFEQKFTEQNQQRLVKSTPPPRLETSLERENLVRRYEFLNDQNKMFYIYLISHGKVMGFYTAKGKISSVNSRLTQEEQIIVSSDCVNRVNYDSEGGCYKTVGSPQLDGSYGTNGDGIFFFTTSGAYIEWNGEYIVSDFPMVIQNPPILVQKVS